MKRRTLCLLTFAFSACRQQANFPPDIFPETVAGVWRRTDVHDLSASEAPDPVPRTSVERLKTAAYEGPGKVEARVYQLASVAVGLDLAQRWRPSADTVFFNQNIYFVVVRWQVADRKALQAFVADLQKQLAPKTR